jgi:transglutaminase-like putative cysteine protease
MRLRIRHELTHRYEHPAKALIQNLRLTPRGHEGQHVMHWRIDLDAGCRLRASQDAFGNIVHAFSLDGPLSELSIAAIGEVETFDTRGVVSGCVERFAPELYLRPTPLTQPNPEVKTLVEKAVEGETSALGRLHALLRAVPLLSAGQSGQHQEASGQSQRMSADAPTAEELAHRFIIGARLIDVPARYVAGYRLTDGTEALGERHGWAEAHVPDLGWVGFDPAHGICPDERYVRAAIGLDSLGAAATRAAHSGGADRPTEVRVTVER